MKLYCITGIFRPMFHNNTITLHVQQPQLSGQVKPVSSKSETNRALMIQALGGNSIDVKNISESDDSTLLQQLLKQCKQGNNRTTLNTDNAGTVMRFLTAYCATQPGLFYLQGNDRMNQRPIGDLVKALNGIGADIQYENKQGFPPLKITGKKITGGEINIDSGTSSQFISALLLCAPYFTNGIVLHLQGIPVSEPYIEMTIRMMQMAGCAVKKEKNTFTILPGNYKPATFEIENDWSAASYYYSMAALSEKADIILEGYITNGLQGDSVVQHIYKNFGVTTAFENNGIRLVKKENKIPEGFTYDFSGCPDLAQTIAVTCAMLGIEAHLTGLKTLRIKETDRIHALAQELKKLECTCVEENESLLIKKGKVTYNGETIKSYGDHRMAMGFAPAVLKTGHLLIENPDVVKKSYPLFWKHLAQLGVSVK